MYNGFLFATRDVTIDTSPSFSMNYHTLATNEDDELNNSIQTIAQNEGKNVLLEKTAKKPRQPLRRSLSAQHRATKVRPIKIMFYLHL